ncbi:MAG: ATP F0F1 synthase subunit B [Alphaproteobacteria bacterium]|nr:ATP F0F1 synthase subunit B [Alphaproteobacteria bacterium]
MSTFRIAVSSLTAGFVVYLLVLHRSEVPGISMALLHNPELYVAVGLAVVIGIFLWKGVPSLLARMLDERAKAIAGELNEAQRLREEAAALLAGYVRKASHAEQEAAAIIADARADAERFAKEMRAQLRLQIDRRAQMAREKIEQAEHAALEEIRALAADKAAAAAEKLIAARLDPARSDSLVQDSIKELPDKLN